jgi:hypothetical protein
MAVARFGLGALDEARAQAVFTILSKVRMEGRAADRGTSPVRSTRAAGA